MSNTTDPWETYVNSGDQAWQLTTGTFVCLQSVPGLIIMYAGLSKAKWSINSAFMGLYAFSATLVIWVIYAYNVAFGPEWFPLSGVPSPVLGIGTALSQSRIPAANATQQFNLVSMVFYQFAFAAITIVIIAGALLGRMNVLAWAIFVPLWITFSYCPVAFSLWGGGFLERLGVIDYAGGNVIHVSSGTAGFIAAAIVGPRHHSDRKEHRPSNLGFCVIGAGLLWCGWTGFNGGASFHAGADSGIAVINTYVCTATALLAWTLCDVLYYKRAAILGCVQGMICGLVAITPCAGVVAGWGAIVLGLVSAAIPWLTMNLLGRMPPLCYVDDTLGVIHTHTVAGVIGGFFAGLFATEDGSKAFGLPHGGAIAGNGRQVWVQVVGFLFVIAWNMAWTPLILFVIRSVFRVPLRAPLEVLLIGDEAIHGEEAYSLSMPWDEQDNRSSYIENDPYRRMESDTHTSRPPTIPEETPAAIAMTEMGARF